MRKTVLALSFAAAAAVATPVWAQAPHEPYTYAPAAGVVAGTVVGLGFAEGWWSSPAALNTAVGGVAVGLVAGIGTAALIHSVTTPCTGFRIAFDSPEACAAARGIAAAPRVERRVERRRR
jgi:hypothetical protein